MSQRSTNDWLEINRIIVFRQICNTKIARGDAINPKLKTAILFMDFNREFRLALTEYFDSMEDFPNFGENITWDLSPNKHPELFKIIDQIDPDEFEKKINEEFKNTHLTVEVHGYDLRVTVAPEYFYQ
jgi:hypothetical protein